MNDIKKYVYKSFSADELDIINKIRIPPLYDPVNIRIYWFQVLCFSKDSSSFYFKEHKHTFHEAHFILDGSMTYNVDGKKLTASKGEFVMIPADTPHTSIECTDNLVKLSLSFEIIVKPDNALSQTMHKSLALSHFICEKSTKEMTSAINLTLALAKRRSPLAPFTIRNEIFTLITEIYYSVSPHLKKTAIAISNDAITDTRYISAKKFIEDNIFMKIKTDDVARHVHLSPKQLNRIFLKYGNTSVFDYIDEQKSDAAKDLLISTDLSLQQISERLGFADEFYFNRYFKQKAGITPLKFRKINGKKLTNNNKND